MWLCMQIMWSFLYCAIKNVLIYDVYPRTSVFLNEDDLSVPAYHVLRLTVMVMLVFNLAELQFNNEIDC